MTRPQLNMINQTTMMIEASLANLQLHMSSQSTLLMWMLHRTNITSMKLLYPQSHTFLALQTWIKINIGEAEESVYIAAGISPNIRLTLG